MKDEHERAVDYGTEGAAAWTRKPTEPVDTPAPRRWGKVFAFGGVVALAGTLALVQNHKTSLSESATLEQAGQAAQSSSALRQGDAGDLDDLDDGQAIKCDNGDPAVYHYADDQRRWYPTAEVAESWNTNWENFVVVDCSSVAKGPEMPFNPAMLDEGDSIKCSSDDTTVYRYTHGLRCLFPDDDIASSWDTNWKAAFVTDCSDIPTGQDMKYNQAAITDGSPIKCDANDGTVFRYEDGTRRLYSDADVAQSWDPNWVHFRVVECMSIPEVSAMVFNPAALAEGQSIMCEGDDSRVYRYVGGDYCYYPSIAIANSWDPDWKRFVVTDCSRLSEGTVLDKYLPLDGDAIKCHADDAAVYRFESDELRLYPTPEIAWSWDAHWNRFHLLDCSDLKYGEDMSLNLDSIPDGQAIKCSADDSAVYQFVDDQRRWYPSDAVASSWDPNWRTFRVVDCSKIPRGSDMEFNIKKLEDGQAVKCNASDPQVFRFFDSKLHLYPNPAIAASWDQDWQDAVVVNCKDMDVGDDMLFNQPAITNGDAIKCNDGSPVVYQYQDGERFPYPDPTVANSWDPHWKNFRIVECMSIPARKPLRYNPAVLNEGQAIKCQPNKPRVYRFSNGEFRLYPTPTIAISWDPSWATAVVTDCSALSIGKNMELYQPQDGDAIKCSASDSAVFRFTDGQRRLYPSPSIAYSWDPHWAAFHVIDCSKIPRGDDLKFNQPDIPEGQAIKCSDNEDRVYRFMAGTRRWYPTEDVAVSWDPHWTDFRLVECVSIPQGDDLAFNPATLVEGQSVKCHANDTDVFRYTNGQRSVYPSAKIGASWDPNWDAAVVTDCTDIPQGEDVKFNQPEISEGQAITCGKDKTVYRYQGGQRRKYPNDEIATSWDADWRLSKSVECVSIPQGDDLVFNAASLHDGQAIKCSGRAKDDESVYRYSEGQYHLYPTPEIADSWDQHWADATVTDCTQLAAGNELDTYTPTNGDAIKCSANATQVYRFVDGQLRLYPDATIAWSWDPHWSEQAHAINCKDVPTGDDMKFNQAEIPEGQAIKCSVADDAVYRYTQGERRWYTEPEVAASWDPQWTEFRVVECMSIKEGEHMVFNPAALIEGQAIKCSEAASQVFRYTSGERRSYPSAAIGTSWDPSWKTAVVTDCGNIPQGEDMELNQPAIADGQAIKCSAKDSTVYRFENGTRHAYPSDAVAESWDNAWKEFRVVNCESIIDGEPMLFNPMQLTDGQAIQCSGTKPNVYRFTDGMFRWYPTDEIAESWDAKWKDFVVTDCSELLPGEDMALFQPPTKAQSGWGSGLNDATITAPPESKDKDTNNKDIDAGTDEYEWVDGESWSGSGSYEWVDDESWSGSGSYEWVDDEEAENQAIKAAVVTTRLEAKAGMALSNSMKKLKTQLETALIDPNWGQATQRAVRRCIKELVTKVCMLVDAVCV
ncbi:TPA: hypothetical protein N0F65_009013 [Lagenidium giganteum]|uniref:Ig-like domain-containing protein n=1 Tax=Lagenidium giganteum TaxID=4803 RepID=A0AAV2YX02_9STRA|nr:TPA: hypothetical protein N0F65_009013 [Lagenidium giganteum]